MAEQIVLFAEEDQVFRRMETALNGKPSPKGLEALRYFFGENFAHQLSYLVSLPSKLGLPPDFRGIVCGDESQLPSLIANADYLVCERTKIDYELMKWGNRRLKLIQKFGSNCKNIDIKAAHSLGIPVAYMRRKSSISVAEHVLALIFALSRNLMVAHETAKNRITAQDELRSEGPPRTNYNWGKVSKIQLVQGKTLGIVGLGEIGSELAQVAHRLGLKIIYYDPWKPAVSVDAQSMSSLEQLVQEADFVSIHVSYGPSTEKMFNFEILSRMKPNAFLINASRGGIIDEQALFQALSEKKISGAALDVYRWEPVPSDCPLLKLNNIIWTTHHAAGSDEIRLEGDYDLLANLARVSRGERPEFLIGAS